MNSNILEVIYSLDLFTFTVNKSNSKPQAQPTTAAHIIFLVQEIFKHLTENEKLHVIYPDLPL